MRKVNWLNINKLVKAINTTGTTIVIISKIGVLEELGNYKLIENNTIRSFNSIQEMKEEIVLFSIKSMFLCI